MTPHKNRPSLAVLLLTAALALPVSGAAALTVYDPANHAENVLQAARALEQINNQILALQNQAVMLQNMARHLQSLDYSALDGINAALARIDGLMTQADGIAFTVGATEAAMQRQFPDRYPADRTLAEAVAAAEDHWRTATGAYRQTMSVQAQIAQNVQADSATIAALVTASQGAAGSLQAQQAANQLAALSVKQLLQIQNLMAAQYRAEAVAAQRQAQGHAAAQAATARFLGSGSAYPPP